MKKPVKRGAAKKAPAKKVDERIQVAEAIDVMTRGMADLYPADPSAPGVVLAYLKGKAVHYASAVRYDQAGGLGKQVIANGEGKTLLEAIQKLLANWTEGTKAARRLRRFATTHSGLKFPNKQDFIPDDWR